jgi:transposase
MLNDLSIKHQVYLVTGYTDLRRSIDGLAAIVQTQLQLVHTALHCSCFAVDDVTVSKDCYGKPMVFCFFTRGLIPGSYCSPELLANIVYEKFCKAVPLHRQEKDFKSKGIPLLKATMSNWVCYRGSSER